MQEALDLPTTDCTDLGITGRLFVWTASHITDESRLEYLKLCIASVREVDPSIGHVVSLSSSIDVDVTSLDVDVRLRDSKKRQFEHFKLIFGEEANRICDDDIIMFLDDDDLLLHLPYFRDGVRSAQWLAHCEVDRLADRKTILESLSRGEWEAINDLSGYALRVKHLRNYLWKCDDSMEDLKLMAFVDALPLVSQPMLPYIYHRMHQSNGTNSEWMSGFIDEQHEKIDEIMVTTGNHAPVVSDERTIEEILSDIRKLQEESALLRDAQRTSDDRWKEEQKRIEEQRQNEETLAIRADQLRRDIYVK